MRVDVGLRDRIEGLVAEREREHLVVVAQRGDEARAVGMPIDAEQRGLAVDARLEQCVNLGTFANCSGEGELLFAQSVHAASSSGAVACAAMRRAMASSSINSCSGGMWSSRSIIAGFGPRRRSV